jgi:hypothetical protein
VPNPAEEKGRKGPRACLGFGKNQKGEEGKMRKK